MRRAIVLGLLLASTNLCVAGARAADMPLFPAPLVEEAPDPQYTWGTGWYLRGDVAASEEPQLAWAKVFGKDPVSKDGWNYAAGAGAGYSFGSLRFDLTGDYLGRQHYSAPAFQTTDPALVGLDRSVVGHIQRWDALVNGYYDIGTWAGFTPYVGAGVGASGFNTQWSALGSDLQRHQYDAPDQYQFAWAAMAGVAFHLDPNMLVDVGYRYLDLGTYKVPLSGERKAMTEQQVRLGIRYMLY